jgi:hypothetical protein
MFTFIPAISLFPGNQIFRDNLSENTGNMETANERPEPIQIRFSVSAAFIARTQNAELSWEVENAETIVIEPKIGNVPAAGKLRVRPFEPIVYTLTASNETETKTETVKLNVFPTPLLENLQIPVSKELRFKAQFVNVHKELPEFPKVSPLINAGVVRPEFQDFNDRFAVNATSVDELSRRLNIPKDALNKLTGKSRSRLHQLLFNTLDRLFSKRSSQQSDFKQSNDE